MIFKTSIIWLYLAIVLLYQTSISEWYAKDDGHAGADGNCSSHSPTLCFTAEKTTLFAWKPYRLKPSYVQTFVIAFAQNWWYIPSSEPVNASKMFQIKLKHFYS